MSQQHPIRIVSLCLLMIASVLLHAQHVFGQSQEELEVSQPTSVVFSVIKPDRWFPIGVTATNPTAQDLTAIVDLEVDQLSGLRLGRQTWMPAQSVRKLTFLGYTSSSDAGASQAVFSTRIFDASQTVRPTAQSQIGGASLRDASLVVGALINPDQPMTRTLSGSLMLALTTDRQEKLTQYIRPDNAPRSLSGYDMIDVLVVSAQPSQLDPLQIQALRGYLQQGGAVIVLAAHMTPEAPSQLFGSAWTAYEADRQWVQAIDVKIQRNVDAKQLSRMDDYPSVWSQPIFKNPEAITVFATQAGQPVAATWAVGQGQLMGLWLGSEAWLATPSEEWRNTIREPAETLLAVASMFLRMQSNVVSFAIPDEESVLSLDKAMTESASSRIGVQTISKGVVMVVLGGFLVGSAVMLLLMGKGLRGEWATAIIAGLAIVAGGVISIMTLGKQSEAPTTISTVSYQQIAEHFPITTSQAYASIYRGPGEAELSVAGHFGVPDPMDVSGQGEVSRLTFLDDGSWVTQGLAFPTGMVKSIAIQGVQPMDAPSVYAQMDLSADPMQITMMGDAGESLTLSDCLIATPHGLLLLSNGNIGLRLERTVKYDSNQWFASATIDQRQLMRKGVYESLLLGDQKPAHDAVLLGWGNETQSATQLNVEARDVQDDLVQLPLSLMRPEPGADITVPWPLMSMQATRGRDGVRSLATVYNSRTRQFNQEISRAGQVILRFEPPDALGVIEPMSGELVIDADAGLWNMSVGVVRNGSVQIVQTLSGPTSEVEIALDADTLESAAFDGGYEWVIAFELKDPTSTGPNVNWSLRHVGLSLKAKAQELETSP